MQTKPPPFPVTQDYFDFAQSEHDRLTKYREEVLVRLQHAREQGDLSENGAYTAAKHEQRETDRNLRHYKYILLYGEVTEPTGNNSVGFGNVVALKANNKNITYRLVSKHEADPLKKKVSIESPIGLALMGKKVGDTATISTPAGKLTYTVQKIS